jgi:chromosome segregation ATPase
VYIESEQLANADTHAMRARYEEEKEEQKRLVQSLNKELEKYKGWMGKFKEENRHCKGDVEKAQRLTREANARTDDVKKEIPPLKKEIVSLKQTITEKQRQITEMLGGAKGAAKDLTPLEKIKEMEEKCARYETVAVEAEKGGMDAKREASSRVREVESLSKSTQEELDRVTSRLAVCEKKLSASRQELGMLKGTPDGEAFAAAEQYKAEVAKSLELAKSRQKEVIKAHDHEQLAKTQAHMIENQLRDEITKLKESRARTVSRLQLLEERNADDHEELRKIKAMDGHWEQQAADLQLVLQGERDEISSWKEQYQQVKGSLDKAADTAVAQEALKVVRVMDDIDTSSAIFEGFLDTVLSQPLHPA